MDKAFVEIRKIIHVRSHLLTSHIMTNTSHPLNLIMQRPEKHAIFVTEEVFQSLICLVKGGGGISILIREPQAPIA